MIYTHDFVHGARIVEVWRGWSNGHWPVRWSEYFGYGYGMPLFEFYAPLPYYFGAIWYGLGVDLVISVKLVMIMASLIAVTGAYFVGKKWGGDWGGVVTAALFTLAPYRAVNIFIRGAVSEVWAMAFFPWITLGILLVIKRSKYGWLVLTLSLVGMMLSHNLSSLLFLPISMVFAGCMMVLQHQVRQMRVWVELFLAYALSVALAAFYLFPAFIEKDLTQLSLIVGGYFDYRLHFVYIRQLLTPYWGYGGSGWGPDDGISFFVGWAFLVGLVMMTAVLIWSWFKKRRQSVGTISLALLCLALGGGALVMTLGKTAWLWEHVPLLSFVQFPWRWLSAASWWFAMGIGLGVTLLPAKMRGAVSVLLICVAVLTQARYFQPEKYIEPTALYYDEPARIVTHMSDILMDYVPATFDYRWAEQNPLLPGELLVEPAGLQETILEIDSPHLRQFSATVSEPTEVVLGIADFPEWHVRANGEEIATSRTERGLISFQLPEGTSLIEVSWVGTLLRRVSDLVSGLAWVGLIFVLGRYLLSNRSRHERMSK